jgi:phosphoglycolate phosphatase
MTSDRGSGFHNIIFDLDGTLIDSRPGIEACLRHALELVEPGSVLPRVESLIGPPVRDMIAALLPHRDADVLDEAEAAFRRCYDSTGWRLMDAYEGVDDTLTRLAAAGLRLFVLTNKPAGPTGAVLDSIGWRDRFETVLCRDSFSPPFGDKAVAMAFLLSSLALDPASTLMVGDSADDARAASSNGVGFAAASWGYGSAASQSGAGCALTTLADLPGLLGLGG